jgi:8-oxo-dGTP pyrophosphatase MutT (NUDIX family)
VTESVCDHASVGVIARDEQGRILLIKRKKYPFGIAPPSGHLDGLSYPVACFKEFEEETGLTVVGAPRPVIPKNPRKDFPCRRGGQYHYWQIFEVSWKGELKPSEDETLGADWYSADQIKVLAENGELEPTWHEFFKELDIIP